MKYNLSIAGKDFNLLKKHLYSGDGKESVAIALCGRQKNTAQLRILVHEIILIPYSHCSKRKSDLVTWSTEIIIPYLEKAMKKNWGILKIHSHPTGYNSFSNLDDISDREFFQSIFGWMENDEPHASAIMLPTGEIFGRIFHSDLKYKPINNITIVGDNIFYWDNHNSNKNEEFALRTIQAFGLGTINKLKKLKVAVIGCSGTGSPLIEQLIRLGIGEILLVDPDKVEKKNLNRIVNSTMNDALNNRFKVDVIKKAIKRIGIGTKVSTSNKNIYDCQNTINEIASCNVIFGCVDSIDGRHLLNQIASFYLIPYFDLGVKIISDGKGGINQIMGTVHYLQPHGSSLRTRGVYSNEGLRAAGLYRTNIKDYSEQKKMGYIVDVAIDSPAVISINTQISSIAVNEFLARIHPFRYDSNENFAVTRISFTDSYIQYDLDGEPDNYLNKFIGRGDMLPLLNMPELH